MEEQDLEKLKTKLKKILEDKQEWDFESLLFCNCQTIEVTYCKLIVILSSY